MRPIIVFDAFLIFIIIGYLGNEMSSIKIQTYKLTMSIKVIFEIIKLYDVVCSLNILLKIFVTKYVIKI